MGYVSITLREEDVLNGIFVRAGREVIPGGCQVTLYEEDYRSGVLIRGFMVEGELIPYTWTDDSGDYRAVSHPALDDGEVIVEQYGGTREQFRHHKEQHARFCEVQGWTQGVFSHHPAWGT